MDLVETNIPKNNSFEELRKTHPKAFIKWSAEEDESLLAVYKNFLENGDGDFEKFLSHTAVEFGRKEGGIRGRLAKYFTDIPGWDYEFQAKREAEKKTKEKIKKAEREEIEKETEKESAVFFDTTENMEAAEILHILEETNNNLFFTGEAGTGKSTLLQHFRNTTKKNVIALAPTGVAALNIEGQTIHSFCAFGTDITVSKVKKLPDFSPKKKLLKNVNTIIIDEISMVRADLLDCVDRFLRINGYSKDMPFGGIQMVFVGDLYQLPPVEKDFHNTRLLVQEYKSPYFFDSRSFRESNFLFRQLKTVYRQKDRVFLEVLNAVRNNAVSTEHLQILNQQVTEEDKFTFEQFAIYLTTTNQRARQVNNFFLDKIESQLYSFVGKASGTFEDREPPTDFDLRFKVGAQVMMLNNDAKKRWVNGTVGKILGVEQQEEEVKELLYEFLAEDEDVAVSRQSMFKNVVVVELETGDVVRVEPYTWEMVKFVYDSKNRSIDSKPTGNFTQYPFKLAWAVTIHKSQGKTFDKVYVDLATGTFAHGQLYVALSRCRTLEGLRLRRSIVQQDVVLDTRVVDFLNTIT